METPVYDRMSRAFPTAGTVLAKIVGSASKLKQRMRTRLGRPQGTVMLVLASAELAAAYITAAVAALAIVGSLVTTGLTLRHQRLQAEEERLSNRRADAYIRLLEHQHEDPAFEQLLPPQVASRLLAYGSEDVNRALGLVRRTRDRSGEAFNQAIDALVRQIRTELQGKPDQDQLDAVTRWQDH